MSTMTRAAVAPLGTAFEAVATGVGLSICIPVYNEEDAVGETLERCLAIGDDLRRQGVTDFEVIAVDDGSSDRTAEVIAGFPQVRLLRHGTNRGYGAALKTAFEASRHELIAFLDADATYPPEWLPRLCARLRDGRADMVVGSRMAGAETEMPLVRRIGNGFFASLLRVIGRTPITDAASGMRVFNRSVLSLVSPLPDGLNLTPVMSTRAAHEGIDVVEVPIPYRERVGASKLSVVRDGLRFLSTMITAALAYNPVRVFGIAGLACVGASAVVLLGLLAMRLSGTTVLGPLGTFAVFGALVCGVTGVTVFALGATFNYVVSLFYNRPIRQGLFRRPLLRRPIEDLFLPSGLFAFAAGVAMAVASLVLARQGWPIERLWLYLTSSAMAVLIGVQLVVWWLMASVLRQLSRGLRDAASGGDRQRA
ncbi:MAG: glycosyltransferase family 2 protein [Vicinamibacterales bacterium]